MWISRSPVAAIVNSTGAEGRNAGAAEEVPSDRLDDGDLDAAPGAQLGQTVAARRTAAASQRARIPGFFLDRDAPQTPDSAAAPILRGHGLI